MTRPGTDHHLNPHPGHHYLDHSHHKCKTEPEPIRILWDLEGGLILTESDYSLAIFQESSCDNVLCGPNEVCKKGCCVCIAGYKRNSEGKCVPYFQIGDTNPEPPLPPVGPDVDNAILQEVESYIFTENFFVLTYDPSLGTAPPVDPCLGVVCGPNELCSKGICIPDPNYNPCLGVYCLEGYVCIDGNCVRNTLSQGIVQENEALIFTEDYDTLNYE